MRTPNALALFISGVLAGLPLACAESSPGRQQDDTDVSASQHPHLQWKRYAVIEADLSAALDLPAEELCTEFGVESCINGVHLAPLGGNEPFKTGLLEPTAEPLATTPAVIDRLLLSSCGHRVELDRAAGKSGAKVFRHFELEGDAPDPSDAALEKTITDLYRRFLSRNPTADESAKVATLVHDESDHPVSSSEFAITACFAIGSTAEFEFY
jgi:hypothetical protein